MQNNIYLCGSREANLFYCDSNKSLENCTVTSASGEVTTPLLLKKEELENGTIRHTFDAKGLTFWSPPRSLHLQHRLCRQTLCCELLCRAAQQRSSS